MGCGKMTERRVKSATNGLVIAGVTALVLGGCAKNTAQKPGPSTGGDAVAATAAPKSQPVAKSRGCDVRAGCGAYRRDSREALTVIEQSANNNDGQVRVCRGRGGDGGAAAGTGADEGDG